MSDADDITEVVEFFALVPSAVAVAACATSERDHWFYCKEHKVKWGGGSNLNRTEEPMTAAEVATTARYLKEAALNGWQQSRSRFRVKTLLRGGVHDGYARSAYDDDAIVDPISIIDLFDHAVFFREIARPTARLPSSASPIRGDDPDAWQFNREPDDAAARHDPAAPEAPQDAPPPLMPCAHCGRTDSGVYQMKDIRFFDPLNPPPGEEPMVYLHEGCTQAFFANGTAEPGLSPGRIRELAAWYLARATAQHEANEAGDIGSAELDADLRLILREEVFPEFVEMEFGRVMKAVFSEIA